MELDPRRLRVLRAVALRGGMAGAAQLLHLTPSAISQQLAQLEREVGQPLIDRSRRTASLTPAGELLAVRAERIEQELAEARRELTELSGRLSGPVTIAAFSSAVCNLVVPALLELSTTHPDLEPEVVELEGVPALSELRTGGVDLVIAEYDAGGVEAVDALSGLSAVPVADDEYRVVTPSAWSPQPGSIKDLAARPWVASPPDTASGRALDRIATQYGFTARRAHTCLEFPTILALVAAGFGAAIAPKLALTGASPEAIAMPSVPVAGHRRITVLRRHLPAGPEPLTQAVVEALRAVALDLGLTPVPRTRRR
ncbi:LysR family transcriptional regulator [Kribbella sp. NBC_00709]|uniref:LysR family transcriptional regulator n=1 Tax=Kribbella sp. NBC_00709 TaxID=2975972 RepID=UPI002E2AA87B|nr:LysR family transcriptional regulator [Kribbella sp. NBC_00709]